MLCYTCEKYEICNRPWKCSDTMQGCSAYRKEQTNEEWLRTLPTEERVKEVLSRGFMTEKRTAEEFVEWLKEKHDG